MSVEWSGLLVVSGDVEGSVGLVCVGRVVGAVAVVANCSLSDIFENWELKNKK